MHCRCDFKQLDAYVSFLNTVWYNFGLQLSYIYRFIEFCFFDYDSLQYFLCFSGRKVTFPLAALNKIYLFINFLQIIIQTSNN